MKQCTYCGTKFDDFLNNQILGCPYCYQTFEVEIQQILEKNIDFKHYKGLLPDKKADSTSSVITKEFIQAKLDSAVENEDYEKAAFYRDFLKALEQDNQKNKYE